MFNYYKVEKLKIKHTFNYNTFWIAPLLTIILSFFLTGDYFQVDNYNWWYTFIFPGFISIISIAMASCDKDMKYRGILALPIDIKRVWIGKVINCTVMAIKATMIIFIGTVAGRILNIGNLHGIEILNGFYGALVLIITYIWQIPFCMFLSEKLGKYLVIVLNVMFNIIGILFFATEKTWYLYPYAYGPRIMCPIIKVLPNGLMAVKESETYSDALMATSSIPIAIIISLMLYVCITLITAKLYQRKEAM